MGLRAKEGELSHFLKKPPIIVGAPAGHISQQNEVDHGNANADARKHGIKLEHQRRVKPDQQKIDKVGCQIPGEQLGDTVIDLDAHSNIPCESLREEIHWQTQDMPEESGGGTEG